jgi:hypothetical protein
MVQAKGLKCSLYTDGACITQYRQERRIRGDYMGQTEALNDSMHN